MYVKAQQQIKLPKELFIISLRLTAMSLTFISSHLLGKLHFFSIFKGSLLGEGKLGNHTLPVWQGNFPWCSDKNQEHGRVVWCFIAFLY